MPSSRCDSAVGYVWLVVAGGLGAHHLWFGHWYDAVVTGITLAWGGVGLIPDAIRIPWWAAGRAAASSSAANHGPPQPLRTWQRVYVAVWACCLGVLFAAVGQGCFTAWHDRAVWVADLLHDDDVPLFVVLAAYGATTLAATVGVWLHLVSEAGCGDGYRVPFVMPLAAAAAATAVTAVGAVYEDDGGTVHEDGDMPNPAFALLVPALVAAVTAAFTATPRPPPAAATPTVAAGRGDALVASPLPTTSHDGAGGHHRASAWPHTTTAHHHGNGTDASNVGRAVSMPAPPVERSLKRPVGGGGGGCGVRCCWCTTWMVAVCAWWMVCCTLIVLHVPVRLDDDTRQWGKVGTPPRRLGPLLIAHRRAIWVGAAKVWTAMRSWQAQRGWSGMANDAFRRWAAVDDVEAAAQVLGVPVHADERTVRAAYHAAARAAHPDMLRSGATEEERANAETRFRQVQEAYEVLSGVGGRSGRRSSRRGRRRGGDAE